MSDDPLDQINRAVISVIAMLVAFAALVVVLLAWGAPDASIDRIEDLAGYLRDHNTRDARLIVTLGAIVVVLLMLTVIIVQLTPSPTQKMRVRNVKAGDAQLTTPQIAARIEHELADVSHVASSRAIVSSRGQKLTVVLDLEVDAGADLARTADEACRRAHELIEQQMGLVLAERPRARLHYRELRLKDDATKAITGWERPHAGEGAHDQRGSTDPPEEAQAQTDRAAGA